MTEGRLYDERFYVGVLHDRPELAEESSRALADQCGISYRQLSDWLDKGLVSPRHVGVGRGNTRVLTPAEIARVRYLAALTHEYENVFGKQGRPSSDAGRKPTGGD